MSVYVLTDVWKESKASGSALLVLLAIADNATDEGFAWPKRETLAKKARMSDRSIQRIVGDLERAGELWVDRSGNAVRKTNKYRVLLGGRTAPRQSDGRQDDSPSDGRHASPQRETPAARTGDTGVSQNRYLTVSEPLGYPPYPPSGGATHTIDEQPKRKRTTSSRALDVESDDGFAAFLASYPNRKDKARAAKAWAKLAPSAALVETIIGDVMRRRAGEWCGKDPQFIPYPASYLNGRRWTDEPDEAPQTIPVSAPKPPADGDIDARIAWLNSTAAAEDTAYAGSEGLNRRRAEIRALEFRRLGAHGD